MYKTAIRAPIGRVRSLGAHDRRLAESFRQFHLTAPKGDDQKPPSSQAPPPGRRREGAARAGAAIRGLAGSSPSVRTPSQRQQQQREVVMRRPQLASSGLPPSQQQVVRRAPSQSPMQSRSPMSPVDMAASPHQARVNRQGGSRQRGGGRDRQRSRGRPALRNSNEDSQDMDAENDEFFENWVAQVRLYLEQKWRDDQNTPEYRPTQPDANELIRLAEGVPWATMKEDAAQKSADGHGAQTDNSLLVEAINTTFATRLAQAADRGAAMRHMSRYELYGRMKEGKPIAFADDDEKFFALARMPRNMGLNFATLDESTRDKVLDQVVRGLYPELELKEGREGEKGTALARARRMVLRNETFSAPNVEQFMEAFNRFEKGGPMKAPKVGVRQQKKVKHEPPPARSKEPLYEEQAYNKLLKERGVPVDFLGPM
ncbi:hypothetical protein BDY21DRAFT_336483 [Lineolata rhizophorae]|uniref:Uncharacterized protein n=1 Tax=Lineolata rhizophorae TaxID=578093 RepID=A0A6A6P7I6_9PEZI|nr:hypothetical protein BDY21DRAFT_336483 [Lineolata rhizophorae]